MDEQMNENLEPTNVQVKTEENLSPINDSQAVIAKLKKQIKISYVLVCVALLLGVTLLIMSLCCGNSKQEAKADAQTPKTLQSGSLKIAYINTDTIMEKYQYAKELEAGLKTYQQQIENELRATAENLQRDYEDYMKNGDKLTLTKQKEKEKELTERQQRLPSRQQEMAAKLQERNLNDNKKLVDAIYAFIAEYNKTHDNFNIILRKEYINSPVLYIDKGMDITDKIVKGLNEEYKSIKK